MFTSLKNRNGGAMFILFLLTLVVSCSKNSSYPPDPCAGVNVVINGTVTHTSGGLANGAIAATATGSTGITFSINGGAFQASGNFTNLAAGTYTVAARNASGCSASASFTINAADPCAGKTITVSPVVTGSDKCTPSGTVVVTAAGSTGFTYKLNASGAFQASNSFSGVAAGNHVVIVRDAGGCEKTANITVSELPLGPKFIAVATLLRSRCTPCHTTQSEGGANYNSDCNIVSLQARIKARAVDIGDMPNGGPALSASEKQIITDWITAGGKSSN
ncbi:MAG TPA: hypothetical protein VLC98_10940 [Phnomibacter sp.]|nr:hypothetical protein [Phnomibacter sp.]